MLVHPMITVLKIAFLTAAAYFAVSFAVLAIFDLAGMHLAVGVAGLLAYIIAGYAAAARIEYSLLGWSAVAGLTLAAFFTLVAMFSHVAFTEQPFNPLQMIPRFISLGIGVGLAVLGGWIAEKSRS